MGCCAAKTNGLDDTPLPEMKLEGLDANARFEFTLPFYRIRLEAFVTKVKAAAGDSKEITIAKLTEALGSNAAWGDLQNNNSVLVKVLKSEYFKGAEEGSLSTDSLIIYAVLHSAADARTRAHVLYDVLQDNNQPFISANDKDFDPVFDKLVDLATKLVYSHVKLVVPDATPVGADKFEAITSFVNDSFREKFLDDVFGANSKLQREEWEKVVSTTGKWLFSAKEVRALVEKEI